MVAAHHRSTDLAEAITSVARLFDGAAATRQHRRRCCALPGLVLEEGAANSKLSSDPKTIWRIYNSIENTSLDRGHDEGKITVEKSYSYRAAVLEAFGFAMVGKVFVKKLFLEFFEKLLLSCKYSAIHELLEELGCTSA
ncbi:hypothetical protein KSP40_PGU016928 [Platanthera guangdongensis]|uniref:Uncharacterized protein n=1 Tax=Platanthera guangdongensis TaxID=2320717 RepID=A0ABR2LQ46_9ASPA